MSGRCFYVSSRGERHCLDGPGLRVGTANGLRGRKWTYSLGYRSASGISRDAREVEVDALFEDLSRADALRRAADRDVREGSPGAIEVDGAWTQRAMIVASEVQTVFCGFMAATLTVLLLDGSWRREVVESFRPQPPSADEWLNFPHGYPYNYGGSQASASIKVEGSGPAPARIVVYGPAPSVDIGIGGNRYKVGAEVPPGSLLEIDGASFPKTIRLVGEYGDVSDRFSAGERGLGEGSGDYVFQPLEPGAQAVSWDRSYGFDVHYFVEEGEPPWTSS